MTTMSSAPHLLLTDFDEQRLVKTAKDLRSIGGPYTDVAAKLETELARAEVCPRGGIAPGVVTMNSLVRILDLRTRERSEFTLTYPTEADILDDRISVISPLGLALLGKNVGAEIEIYVPAGTRRFRIERILYQPEAAGDEHL